MVLKLITLPPFVEGFTFCKAPYLHFTHILLFNIVYNDEEELPQSQSEDDKNNV